MIVVYVAKHRCEAGETVICLRPEGSGVPRAGDWVRLHNECPPELVELVTLVPGQEWRVQCEMPRQDAEALREALKRGQ